MRPTIGTKIEVSKRYYNIGSCVYKLFYNSFYVIVKAKNCYGSMKMIEKSLNQFLKGSEAQMKPDNLYLHFFSYIKKHKGGEFRVEIMSKPEATEYELLIIEEGLVKAAKKDKRCLNNINGAYICQWNEETGEYNWLPRSAVANFMRYKKGAVKKVKENKTGLVRTPPAKKKAAKKKK